MITTSLAIIHHHTVEPFTHFTHPQPPSPLLTSDLYSISIKFAFILFGLFYRFHICMKSHSIGLSLFELCYLAWHVQGLPMLSQVADFHSFLWLRGIKYIWYIYMFISIYISHLLYPFIHQQTFGMFHILAIVNDATMNIRLLFVEFI